MRRAALLGLAVLAGCGGGDPGGDPATYARAGRAICADYRTAIGRLGQPTRITEIGPYIGRALPILTRTVRRIERLDPPAKLADDYAAFRAAARETVARADAMRDAAEKADAPEVQRLLREAARAGRSRAGLAKAAGLEECSPL